MTINKTALGRPMQALVAMCAAVLVVTLAGCGSSSTGSTDGSGDATLKIGFVTTLSKNPFTDIGEQGEAAFKAALADSKDSGLDVKTYKVDDQGDATTATQVCQQLIQQDKVDVIVALQLTPNKNACTTLAHQAGIPFIAGQQSAVNCDTAYFQTGWIPNQTVEPALKYAAGKGAKSVYYVGNDYAFDQSILAEIKASAPKLGLKVAGSSLLPIGTTDWAPVLSKIAAAKPDVVIDAMIDEIAYIKQASTDPRTQSLERISLAADEAQLQAVGSSVEGTEFVPQYVSSDNNAANKAFKASMAAANKSVIPSQTSLNVYTAVLAAIAAAKEGTSASDILKALPNVSIDGPGGSMAFAGEHYPTVTSYVAKMGPNFVPSTLYKQENVAPVTGC